MLPPGRYIKLKEPILKEDDTREGFYTATAKVLVKISSLREAAIISALRDYATEHGYSEIAVIDEDFVKEALRREIARRKAIAKSKSQEKARQDAYREAYASAPGWIMEGKTRVCPWCGEKYILKVRTGFGGHGQDNMMFEYRDYDTKRYCLACLNPVNEEKTEKK